MAVQYRQFESEFGFKSPNFSVDDDGNVTLRSISYIVPPDENVLDADYTLTSTGSSFFVAETGTINPTLSLTRGESYTFQITLTGISFNLFVGNLLYNSGLRFTEDGTNFVSGEDAQNQTNGYIVFTVPADAPDQLFIKDIAQTSSLILNIADPVFTGNGNFANLTVTGNVNMLGSGSNISIAPTGTGSLTINPVQGTLSNMAVNATTFTASDTVSITPIARDVTIIPSNTGRLILDSGTTGSLNNVDIGNTTPSTGNFTSLSASAGSLNNVVIGNITPTTGNFTNVSIQENPVNGNDVTTKRYVDSTSIALAIAFGL